VSGINRQPAGLLSFFGIKNTGRNPRDLATTISPTLDLHDWYLSQNSESVVVNSALAALGFSPFYNVPETETWALLGVAVNSGAALGAGQSLRCGAAWTRPSPTAAVIAPLTNLSQTETTGAVAISWSAPEQLVFVPPGASIGVYTSVLVAGPVSVNLHLTRIVMRI